ncbi:hypothetical protein ACWGH8_02235 [Nonomuraea muscovyensis]
MVEVNRRTAWTLHGSSRKKRSSPCGQAGNADAIHDHLTSMALGYSTRELRAIHLEITAATE